MSRFIVPVLFAFVSIACHQLPPRRGADVQTSSPAALSAADPIEIVLAPVVDARTQKGREMELPVKSLRAAFQEGLVQRRYSPLSLDLVDTKVVNANYRAGALEEEAILTLTVERWDTSLWTVRNSITVSMSASLTAPSGAVLWSGRLEDKRMDFADVKDQFTTETALIRHACGKLSTEVLAALPSRSPKPGLAR